LYLNYPVIIYRFLDTAATEAYTENEQDQNQEDYKPNITKANSNTFSYSIGHKEIPPLIKVPN